jgi:hypothetical protein
MTWAFLFPFYNQPEVLARLLKPIFPTLIRMLPIEDGSYVSFEWIGQDDYLNEKGGNKTRSRGANCTSADAAVMFQHENGQIQMVLIEWKYTESYSRTNLEIAASGKSRAKIYCELFHAEDSPIDHGKVPKYEFLFYEPFYQFMRQQLLAHAMEKSHEKGADLVSLLHLSPAHNLGFKRVTSPGLIEIGDTATAVWGKFLKAPEKFCAAFLEDLFGQFDPGENKELRSWYDYISARYRWICENQEVKMLHPLVEQLHFARKEFLRGIEGVTDEEARRRFLPMNCISWNVGHLAWQEQRYWLTHMQGKTPVPEINPLVGYRQPASTPPLADMLAAWHTLTAASDKYLQTLTSESILQPFIYEGQPTSYSIASRLQRVLYHYWYHTGENMAIRQLLGHKDLPEFVGSIEDDAPYRPG